MTCYLEIKGNEIIYFLFTFSLFVYLEILHIKFYADNKINNQNEEKRIEERNMGLKNL